MQSGILYVIATPIGNLEDMTLRAIRVLKEVDVVLCEDTRTTGKLLAHYEIKKKLVSYHANATDKKHEYILELLGEGKTLALVSDAGTPCISDPGAMLVKQVREALPDVHIFTIPGASAVTGALSISGIPSSEFLFLGFAPHKKGRKTFFERVAMSDSTVIFYESPHRFAKMLAELTLAFGDGNENRKICVGRELSKLHEESVYGALFDILLYFKQNPDHIRGEFAVVVQGKR